MKKILLVDDDENFRRTLKNLLNKNNFNVIEANDGEVAQNLFVAGENFDLVISDFQMPNLSGLDLLKVVKEKSHKTPFILMTGFKDLVNAADAISCGVDDFIPKPFKVKDILDSINRCIKEKEGTEENKDLDNTFFKLNIDDFLSGKKIIYPIYIRLSKRKYIKVAHKGEDVDEEKLQEFKKRNVLYLYLTKEDFRKYVNFTIVISKSLKGSKAIPLKKKKEFVQHTGELISQKIYSDDFDQRVYNQAKNFFENSLSVMLEQPDIFEALEGLRNHTDYLYAHCVGVSLFSIMIANKLKWNSPQTEFKVAMGAMFHDIGKREIDEDLLKKPTRKLDHEQVKILESHPNLGIKFLGQFDFVPSDVIQIVHQHHEDCLGYGYPNGITKSKIFPLARLISVANIFCNYLIENPNSFGMSGEEAIKEMISLYQKQLDSEFMAALAELFGLNYQTLMA